MTLDEALNLLHFYFFLDEEKDYELLEHIAEFINLLLSLLMKEDQNQVSLHLQKISEYCLQIFSLQESSSALLKSAAINILFTLYGDETYDQFFYQNQMLEMLESQLEFLEVKSKFDQSLQNHSKLEDLEETLENLREFIEYKKKTFN